MELILERGVLRIHYVNVTTPKNKQDKTTTNNKTKIPIGTFYGSWESQYWKMEISQHVSENCKGQIQYENGNVENQEFTQNSE